MADTRRTLTGLGQALSGVGRVLSAEEERKRKKQEKDLEAQNKAIEQELERQGQISLIANTLAPEMRGPFLDWIKQTQNATGATPKLDQWMVKSFTDEFQRSNQSPISVAGQPAMAGALFQPGSQAPLASIPTGLEQQTKEAGLNFDLQNLFNLAGQEPSATLDQQRQDLMNQMGQVLQPLIASGLTQQGIQQLMGSPQFLKEGVIGPVTQSRQAEQQQRAAQEFQTKGTNQAIQENARLKEAGRLGTWEYLQQKRETSGIGKPPSGNSYTGKELMNKFLADRKDIVRENKAIKKRNAVRDAQRARYGTDNEYVTVPPNEAILRIPKFEEWKKDFNDYFKTQNPEIPPYDSSSGLTRDQWKEYYLLKALDEGQ